MSVRKAHDHVMKAVANLDAARRCLEASGHGRHPPSCNALTVAFEAGRLEQLASTLAVLRDVPKSQPPSK